MFAWPSPLEDRLGGMHTSDKATEFTTLIKLLRWRALRQPDQRAFTFLLDGGSEETHWTYAELDQEARTIAAGLQRTVSQGELALLLYPPGLEFIAAFFGCLYAGVIAVPLYPPHPARLSATLPRLQAIAAHARAKVVLTTASVQTIAEPLLKQVLYWLATDRFSADLSEQWQEPEINKDNLAYIQYTSGATAAPKGVMLSHGNLLANSALIYHHFGHTSKSRGFIWLPPYHDMGLIGGVLQPIYAGFPVCLMSPTSFLLRPVRWLQSISRIKATTSGGPNFAYELCVQKITAEQRTTLDLSSWEVAFSGAEAVRHDTFERFAETFSSCGFRREAFYPCYGLAEASLFVTGRLQSPPAKHEEASLVQNRTVVSLAEGDGVRRLVGCGQIPPGQTIIIVDPESCTRCPSGKTGEIWVSGPSVAHGYLHWPDETVRVFKACLADSGEGPFLRTGDLGFFRDGELYITGRIKDLIIIGGRNHYPEDIEQTVKKSHAALMHAECAAFSIDNGGEERLVITAEVNRRYRAELSQAGNAFSAEFEIVRQHVRKAVAEQHDLRVDTVILLKPSGLPRTASGKIQRHACRAGFLAGTLNVLVE